MDYHGTKITNGKLIVLFVEYSTGFSTSIEMSKTPISEGYFNAYARA